MSNVPKWVFLSSGLAPLLFIGGWVVAARMEGPPYNPVSQTISVLAAYGAAGSWVMTGALVSLGICHLLTAWGLRPAAVAGRAALAGGGVAALLVAMIPAPLTGGSLRHSAVAVVGFTLLAAWPVLAANRSGSAPWALRRAPSIMATAVILAGAAWFLFEIERQGAAGVAERFVTGVQSFWPFVVVASCLQGPRRSRDQSA
ncbi:DUF998 domain-containing protein [Streptomyces fructofermentans]|uniref:DUF998 domain-containing protein n=1 Tax=Streptomyces fructofermentans TaxID=152141 RepID=UPI003798A950